MTADDVPDFKSAFFYPHKHNVTQGNGYSRVSLSNSSAEAREFE